MRTGPRDSRDRQESQQRAFPGRPERISAAAVLTAAGAAGVLLYFLQSLLLPFVIAGILAYVFTPLIDELAARTRWPRWLFAMAILLGLMTLVGFIGFLGFPAVAREAARLAGDLQGTVAAFARELIGDRTFHLAGESVNAAQIGSRVASAVRNWLGAEGRLLAVVAFGIAGLFGFILTWVLLGYALLDAPRIGRGLLWLVPPARRPFVARVWRELDPVLRRYFVGVALVVLFTGAVAYVGLGLVLRVPHAVLLSLLAGVLELVPIIGPAASALAAGLVALQNATGVSNVFAYVAYAIALRVSIDHFFGPVVLGRTARLPPMLVIFCFLSGGVLFGIVGVMLSVPAALAVKVVLANFYREPHS